MAETGSTQGSSIRVLFASAVGDVAVIAPFIKVDALRSLLDVIPENVRVRCVTRWLPREVAAGVSDPEILDVLEERGDFNLSLVDRLHAKLYISGDKCLVGSSNVTFAGMGEGGGDSNIEVLVETVVDDPSIVATLREISQAERPATRAMARAARRLADNLPAEAKTPVDADAPWFPGSRRPEYAFHFYSRPPNGYVGTADGLLLADLARSNVQPGLDEDEFRSTIRSLLSAIPIADVILKSNQDRTFTRADAQSYLESIPGDQFSVTDLWNAFVNWMAYFFPDLVMKQEISEIALRRAQIMVDR